MPFLLSVAATNACSRIYKVCDEQQGCVGWWGLPSIGNWGMRAYEQHGAMVKEKNGWLFVSVQTETEAWEAWTEVCLQLYSDSATKLILCFSSLMVIVTICSHLFVQHLGFFFSPYNFKLVNLMEIIMGNVWKIRKIWQHFYWDQRIASNRNWWDCQCGYCIVSDQQRLVLEVARLWEEIGRLRSIQQSEREIAGWYHAVTQADW